ncbi:macrolide ABC transporter permease/ATP-binding protein MacB [Bordetella sp. J329]|nr:macrolide ABC transporter permease/ATP-binding protein MacB [Bordetella sp. J329]
MDNATPLLDMRGIHREFGSGEQCVTVLQDIDLQIRAGEMVAIVGASGSGKSTLMNLLGCLDRASGGEYRIAGKNVASLDADGLAALRRERFGFIFQRYHLLPDLNARDNVETPAIYAGVSGQKRDQRALALLGRLGLADRALHLPSELSGGQQQRVSIARALMNGGQIVLADEPTGALDSRSGKDVLDILQELHGRGHTVIIVTHDMNVARHAQRIIEIHDGRIIADRANSDAPAATTAAPEPPAPEAAGRTRNSDRYLEAARMAWRAMRAHKLRTFLTMLGIIIGIASVVSVVALGEGSRQRVLADISAIGTNTLEIYSGRGFGDERSGRIRTLLPGDVDALAQQPYVDSITPLVSTNASLRFGNTSASGQINGVNEQYFRVKGLSIEDGHAFNATGVRNLAQEAVIDQNTRNTLFGPNTDPIGQVILLGNVPVRIIGVTAKNESPFGNSEQLNVWVPYTTAMSRILGQSYLRNITIRVADNISTTAAQQGVETLLTRRHKAQDFFIVNTDSIRNTIESTSATMRLLISAIALISLVVGGIGVMNIMLVSVTERTGEIGVRMAIGARRSDIMQQFLIEAVLVCLFGGVLGILGALGIGALFSVFSTGFSMVFSSMSMVTAVACSSLVGIVFGYLPARSAANLDPIVALSKG